MKLESQVVSLELAQKLKELGVKQESLYQHAEYRHGINQPNWEWRITDSLYEGDYDHYRNECSAFTVAELGEMLPEEYPTDSDSQLTIWKFWSVKDKNAWWVRYNNDLLKKVYHTEYADTEADARAKMLIYLLENKLI